MPSPTPAHPARSATSSVVAPFPANQSPAERRPVTVPVLGGPETVHHALAAAPYQTLSPETATLLQQLCDQVINNEGRRLQALAYGANLVDKLPTTLTPVPPKLAPPTREMGPAALAGPPASSDASTSSTPSQAPRPPVTQTRRRSASPAPGPAAKRTRLDAGSRPRPPAPPPGRATAVRGAATAPTKRTAHVVLQKRGLGRVEIPADHVGLLLNDAAPGPTAAVREIRLAINGVPLSMRLDHLRLLLRTPQLESDPGPAQAPRGGVAQAQTQGQPVPAQQDDPQPQGTATAQMTNSRPVQGNDWERRSFERQMLLLLQKAGYRTRPIG